MRSLGSEPAAELDGPAWEAAWAAEIDRRVGDVRDGCVDLVDGDLVVAELRAARDGDAHHRAC